MQALVSDTSPITDSVTAPYPENFLPTHYWYFETL